MRIFIGKEVKKLRTDQAVSAVALAQIEKDIEKTLFSQTVRRTFLLSLPFLEETAAEMKAAADEELAKVFKVLAEVINIKRSNENAQLTSAQLSTGMTWGRGFDRRGTSGSVPWAPLSESYYSSKRKSKPQNKHKFFRYSNKMHSLFGGKRKLFETRLGLSVVSIVQENPDLAARHTNNSDIRRMGMGRVSLRIMPKVSGLMMEMLGSKNWASGNLELDRSIFKGTDSAVKVTGRADRGTYRPLVSPTIQFFMVVRIPSAVRNRLNNRTRQKPI